MTSERGSGIPTPASDRLAREIKRSRLAARLSQPQLAAKVGYSRQYLSQAEQPDRGIPSAELVQALDRALDARGGLVSLRKLARLEVFARRNDLADLPSDTVKSSRDYVGDQEDDEDVKRRTLLGLLGPALTPPLVSRLEELRLGLDGFLPAEPTSRDVDDWEQTVYGYSCEVGTIPAVTLLDDLVADFGEIGDRISAARGFVRAQLIHSGARLAALTAITLLNAGAPRSAERWWRTATRAAEETRDPRLMALVHGRHAVFSLHGAPPARVLALAECAIGNVGSKPCVGAISGLAARAQTLAGMGRHSEASTTLRAIIDMFERLPDGAAKERRGQWSWSEQRLRHVQSYVLAQAGRVEETIAAQRSALACYPAGNFQGPAQVELYGATALIRSGQVTSGASRVVEVIDRLPDWQRRDGLVLRSAVAALNSVPRSYVTHPRVIDANTVVAELASNGR